VTAADVRSPDQWLAATVASHVRLVADVEALSPEEISGAAYPSEWSIAQVLAHLGSGAEIFGLFLQAGLGGEPAPGAADFEPIWERWNAKPPARQAADALVADAAFLDQVEGLDEEMRRHTHLSLFGADQTVADLLRYRLAEHAVHTWDVEVPGDPTATLAPGATALLIDAVGQMVGRVGRPSAPPFRVLVSTSEPDRRFLLVVADTVDLRPGEGDGNGDPDAARLDLPAEAFIRLVYGRLDPQHTPATIEGDADLDALRRTFPGF
jgi:uncharacterized protein (TIGR03083 family)